MNTKQIREDIRLLEKQLQNLKRNTDVSIKDINSIDSGWNIDSDNHAEKIFPDLNLMVEISEADDAWGDDPMYFYYVTDIKLKQTNKDYVYESIYFETLDECLEDFYTGLRTAKRVNLVLRVEKLCFAEADQESIIRKINPYDYKWKIE